LTVAEVRAAGGVVQGDGGTVLVVHRPKYDDWTLPKGKAEPGESDEDCALREVEEETGFRCRLGVELPSTEYVDGYGRSKIVRYWAMTVEGGSFTPNREVDEIEWLSVADAAARMTYDRDRTVLRSQR
jgi:8-oxo-dGTP diphosphatase